MSVRTETKDKRADWREAPALVAARGRLGELQAQLADLDAKTAEAEGRLTSATEALADAEAAALLDRPTDTKPLVAAVAAAREDLDRLDADRRRTENAITLLTDEIPELESPAKAKRAKELHKQYAVAVRRLLTALQEIVAANARVRELWQEAARDLGCNTLATQAGGLPILHLAPIDTFAQTGRLSPIGAWKARAEGFLNE